MSSTLDRWGAQRPALLGIAKVAPGDPRYADLLRRGFNKRFTGNPDYVHLVGSTEQVVEAVQDAVRDGLYSMLFLRRRQYGQIEMIGMSTAGAEADRLFDEHLAAVNDGVGVPDTRRTERTSWRATLTATLERCVT